MTMRAKMKRVEDNPGSVRDSVEAATLREQARMLQSNSDSSHLIVGCVLVAVLLYLGVDRTVLASWFMLLIASNLFRSVVARRYSESPYVDDPQAWIRLYAAAAFVAGLVWGLTGILLFLNPGPVPTTLILFILAGVAAAGVPVAAASVRVYLWFLVPALAPIVVYFMAQDGFVARMMGVLVIFFALVLVKTVRTVQTSMAQNAALNIKNGVLVEELRRLATTDPLTKAWNRRKFSELLESEFYRSRRYAHSLTVALFDIDHFKAINDTYGHAAGDTCLKVFSDYVAGHIRKSDAWARLGGEEFVLMLPNTGVDDAIALCERIRAGVETLEIGHNEERLRMAVSIGVVTCTPADESADALLARADEALYEAKEDGRNQVRFLDSDSAELQVIAAE